MSDITKEELLPCPFCGSDAKINVDKTEKYNFQIVGCSSKTMLCPAPQITCYQKDDGTVDYQWWNRRQSSPEKADTNAETVISDAWRQSVLNACMSTESCYVESDPVKTINNLIDWHIANDKFHSQSVEISGGGDIADRIFAASDKKANEKFGICPTCYEPSPNKADVPTFTDKIWSRMSEKMDQLGYGKNDMDRDDYKSVFESTLQPLKDE